MYANLKTPSKSKKMKQDIILSGVGGQGILSIATVIGEAATLSGIHLKQSEVHGMSQRGGDVESDLRLSDKEIHSDLISLGGADLIISMEPMEALRYLPYLAKDGVVITSSRPFVNIPSYPDLSAEYKKLPNVIQLDIEETAKALSAPKSANMVLLGMAAKYMKLLSSDTLRLALKNIFARKGEKIVEDNIKCFNAGYENI